MKIFLSITLLLAATLSFAQLPADQASDNNVVVGNISQPVQWIHRPSIKGAIQMAQPAGTVWIPPNYTGTDCSPISTCNPGAVLVIDLRGGQFNTTPTGSGTCGSCFSTIFSRSGPSLSAVNTDYGTTGVMQPGTAGSSTLTFGCITTGTCFMGNVSGNFLKLFPNASTSGFQLQDTHGDYISGFNGGTGWPGLQLDVGNGTGAYQNLTMTDVVMGTALASTLFDLNSSGLTLQVPINVPSCTGCGSTPVLVDQFIIGTGGGAQTAFTLQQGAIAYDDSTPGPQAIRQAACNDLVETCNGSGQIARVSGASHTNPTLQAATMTNGTTWSGAGLPTQFNMTYSGTPETGASAGHGIIGVDSNGALLFSSNGGNQFLPGPSSSVLYALCNGPNIGTANNTDYIMFPFQSSPTTCTATTLNNNNQEIPLPAAGTLKNLYCTVQTPGAAGDSIKVWVNNTVTALVANNGTSSSANSGGLSITNNAGDTYSIRYHTNSASDPVLGIRCSVEFVRTP